MQLVLSEKGKLRKADDVELAEKLIETKQKKSYWDVIDEMVHAWVSRTPEEIKALKIEVEDHRDNLVDKKFGQTTGGKDYERRFTLVFPITLQLMIRSLYKAEELPFDREFYQDFAIGSVEDIIYDWITKRILCKVKPVDDFTSATNPEYEFQVLISDWTPLNGGVGQLSTINVNWPINGEIIKNIS